MHDFTRFDSLMTNAFIAYHVVLPVEFAGALRQDAEKSARAAWMELVCITLWLFNVAMGTGPFIDGLPIKNGDFP